MEFVDPVEFDVVHLRRHDGVDGDGGSCDSGPCGQRDRRVENETIEALVIYLDL